MACLWRRCTLSGLLCLECERRLSWGSVWGERLYRDACATLAAEHVLRRIHKPTGGTGPGQLGPAATTEVHPFGVGKSTVRAQHLHHLYAMTETCLGRHTRSSRERQLRCGRMGLGHGVGHPVLFGLAHGSSRRTEGCRRYFHGLQDRSKHRPGLLPEKPLCGGRPVRACEQEVVDSREAYPLPRVVEPS